MEFNLLREGDPALFDEVNDVPELHRSQIARARHIPLALQVSACVRRSENAVSAFSRSSSDFCIGT